MTSARKGKDAYALGASLLYLGQAYDGRATVSLDPTSYNDATEVLREAIQLCEANHLVVECVDAHLEAGHGALYWGLRHGNSLERGTILDKAIDECERASNLISSSDSPANYSEAKECAGLASAAQAVTSTGNTRSRLLQGALAEFTAAIEVVMKADQSAAKLYKERANCYRRLGTYETDLSKADEYFANATRDVKAAQKENARGSHRKVSE